MTCDNLITGEARNTGRCPACGATGSEPCITPSGGTYAHHIHAERQRVIQARVYGRVIEAKVWRHVSGRTASPSGACPWYTESERKEWTLETCGFTIAHPDGTVGIGRVPFKTQEEAQAWIDAHPRFPGMNQG